MILLDINSYAENRLLMKDSYGIFVSTVFFPAMLKRVRPWAIREMSKGDEMCLVVLPELIQDGTSVSQSTRLALQAVMCFQRDEGAMLCREHGYETIQMQIGAGFAAEDTLHPRRSSS